MATVKIGATDTGKKFDSKVIGGWNTSQDAFSLEYGMTAEEAYTKLMEQANMKMDLGGGTTDVDFQAVQDKMTAFNSFLEESNASQQELISGSDFFKNQMAIAERQGATARTPAASALGGGTMSTEDIAGQTAAIKSPLGMNVSNSYKANPHGGK